MSDAERTDGSEAISDAVPEVIDDATGVAAVVAAAQAAPVLAFDLEFSSAERYAPALCLVQLGWADPAAPDGVTVRLIDARATDARPALALLADGRRVAVAHAARQDLGILSAQLGLEVSGLFDTQLAAALLGMGDQLGYGKLVAALCGVTVDKDSQFTDWERRPLSPRQLRYAAADVLYLPRIHAALAAQLAARGRTSWLVAESEAVVAAARAAAAVAPEDAWQQLGARGLDGASMAALRALAAWRQRRAIELDRPLPHVLQDKLLVELARQRPRTERQLRDVRGMTAGLRDHAGELLAAIAAGGSAPAAATPAWSAPSPRVVLWTELILALVARAAERLGIPARLLASRGSAEELARAVDDAGAVDAVAHPLFDTWRREVVGDEIRAWFTGAATLRADLTAPSGVQLQPTQ